ncbi:MAG: beta-propeller domain-containing protein [Candidatus Pacebacteria bacterium]|nr:beta-propeller domain-containing protein [Candidatus Paceibacterota bacterium]
MEKKEKKLFLAIVSAVFIVAAGIVQAAGCDVSRLVSVAAYEKSDAVKNLQTCLIESGYNIMAGATGYYGGQTIGAVKTFYSSWYGAWNGLKVGPLGIDNLKKGTGKPPVDNPVVVTGTDNFKTFASADEFQKYFKAAAQESSAGYYGGGNGVTVFEERSLSLDMAVPSATAKSASGGWGASMGGTGAAAPQAVVDRSSTTNVQVVGIDEPDIVKTDGKEIYYSPSTPIYWWNSGDGVRPMALSGAALKERDYMPRYQARQAKIIKALPVSSMAVDGSIDTSGDLLLSGNTLVVFGNGEISGYNISDAKNPAKKWSIKPEGNSSVIGSRLYNGKIYMVTRTSISTYDTCPIRPLSVGGVGITIPCGSIYHPDRIVPANATFSVLVVDAATGSVERKNSFAGLGYTSIIYMSPENLYVTYPDFESNFGIYTAALKEMNDLLPANVISDINRVSGYDISSNSKMTEVSTIITNYNASLDSDARLRLSNEMSNRLTKYRKNHIRDLDRTIVAKVRLSDLAFIASGRIPGQLLNQFSLDEYNGNLRAATTLGGSWFARSEQANDVYVLDGAIQIKGSVKNLGLTERIYSARFIEDKGYVVTFRQTDPFYVIDLSNPADPKLAGELKIPGYSGYLHPVNKDKIIGVGMENSRVKISYFNVSNPANPVEMDKYSLDEHYSEAVSNHHAFLMDSKHGVFFMPGSNGGYIFSYNNDKLSLVKAVSGINPKRAVYINDNMYIIGDSQISVIDEVTWEKIKEFTF